MTNKEGPTLKILYSCGDCSFHKTETFDVCDKLEKRLDPINTPDENCPFKIKNAENFHNAQLEILKKEEEFKIRGYIDQLFPTHWNLWYRNNTVSFCEDRFDSNSIEKINKFIPGWKWFLTSNDNGELMITLEKSTK